MVLGLTRCGPQPLEVSDAGLVSADAGQRDDAGSPDASMSDAGVVDAGLTDAGLPDAGPVDAGISDAAVADAGASDSGATDAGAIDAGSDAGPTDAGSRDAGTRHRGVYLYDADNVVLDLTARANALSWLRTNGYTDVYLSCERYFGNGSLLQLAAFIQDAKVTYGLDTSLLFSNYEWTLDVNHAAARTQIQTALTADRGDLIRFIGSSHGLNGSLIEFIGGKPDSDRQKS